MCVCRVPVLGCWLVGSIKLGRKSINQQPVAKFIDILLSPLYLGKIEFQFDGLITM